MKAIGYAVLAIGIAMTSSAFAADAPGNHDLSGMRQACAADMASLCGDVQGQQRMMCMQKNRDKVSPGCKQAMAAMGGGAGGGAGGGMMARPAGAPAAEAGKPK